MEYIFQQITDRKIDIDHARKSISDALASPENVTQAEYDLVSDLLRKVKLGTTKTPLRRMQDAVIDSLCDILWEHREFLHANGGNSNQIEWIDDDLDIIEIAYYDREPDGDRQWDLVDQGMRGKYTFADAFELLKTRMENSGLLER